MSAPDLTTSVEYRPIAGFPMYRVGSDGSVWSRCNLGSHGRLTTDWKQLKPGRTKFGHLYVNLHNGTAKAFRQYVHHAVLAAFVGPRPDGMECCHGDRDPANNRLENLRWDTSLANHDDKRKHGTIMWGTKVPSAKLNDDAVREIFRLRIAGLTQQSIAARVGVSQSAVSKVLLRKTWKHIPTGR